jgi:hypothetical protein
MSELLITPVLLDKTHNTSGFDCGKPPLNNFLIKYALQNQLGGGARTYVMVRGNRVVGYYSLAPASVLPEDTPSRVIKGRVVTLFPSFSWLALLLILASMERG